MDLIHAAAGVMHAARLGAPQAVTVDVSLLRRMRASLDWDDEMWERDLEKAEELDAALVADIDKVLARL